MVGGERYRNIMDEYIFGTYTQKKWLRTNAAAAAIVIVLVVVVTDAVVVVASFVVAAVAIVAAAVANPNMEFPNKYKHIILHFPPEALRAKPRNFYGMVARGQVSVSSVVARLAVQWQPGDLIHSARYNVIFLYFYLWNYVGIRVLFLLSRA